MLARLNVTNLPAKFPAEFYRLVMTVVFQLRSLALTRSRKLMIHS